MCIDILEKETTKNYFITPGYTKASFILHNNISAVQLSCNIQLKELLDTPIGATILIDGVLSSYEDLVDVVTANYLQSRIREEQKTNG